MTAAQPPATATAERWARSPFYFNSAAHIIRIVGLSANTLAELLAGLRTCPAGSIFEHTFQTLHEHHYVREGFSNDFAYWAFAACNEAALAERLASIDIRDFSEVEAVRERLVAGLEEYFTAFPHARDRIAFEPFYFCASDAVVIPTEFVARNLREFGEAVRRVSLRCLHYHFIDARLRLKLNSNDFSLWLERDLELPGVAARINRIDMYTSTLEDVRQSILRTLERA